MSLIEREKEYTELALMDCRCFLDPMLFDMALMQVDAVRRKRIAACDTAEDKHLSLGVGIMGEMLLRRHGLEGRLRFAPEGHPLLYDGTAYISFSHGGHYAMAGISSVPLGVDVEVVRPGERVIAKHF